MLFCEFLVLFVYKLKQPKSLLTHITLHVTKGNIFLIYNWQWFSIIIIIFFCNKVFYAERCGSFLELNVSGCKEVVQRKSHTVEILEVKICMHVYIEKVAYIWYKTIKINLLSDYCVAQWCLCGRLFIDPVVSWQVYKLTSWHIDSGPNWGIQYISLTQWEPGLCTIKINILLLFKLYTRENNPMYFNDNIIKCLASSNPKINHNRASVIFINIWPDDNIRKPTRNKKKNFRADYFFVCFYAIKINIYLCYKCLTEYVCKTEKNIFTYNYQTKLQLTIRLFFSTYSRKRSKPFCPFP